MGHRDQGTGRQARRRLGVAAAALLGGVAMAACGSSSSSSGTTTTAASGSASTTTSSATATGTGHSAGVKGIGRSSTATFSVTYAISNSSTGKNETVTFAQSPPRESVVTGTGSFFINGSSVVVCQGSGSSSTCTSLPAAMTTEVDGLTRLFSPGILSNTLKGIDAQVAAHAAGVGVTTSSATYGGLASTCAKFTSPQAPAGVVYCASDSDGVLTYFSSGGNVGTLTAYSASPPASAFSPPAGVTVQTLPAGTP